MRERTQIDGFDPDRFVEDLKTTVFAPLLEAQELFEINPFFTRFYTVMSPQDMTRDPRFTFTNQLDVHPRIHTAQKTVECDRRFEPGRAPWKITTPQGDVVRGEGIDNGWQVSATDDEVPASRTVTESSEDGKVEQVTDNSAEIEDTLESHNQEQRDAHPHVF